jgi:cephalosporin hydroxylase
MTEPPRHQGHKEENLKKGRKGGKKVAISSLPRTAWLQLKARVLIPLILFWFQVKKRLYRLRSRIIGPLFHRLYYEGADYKQTWMDTYWMGVPTYKLPSDMWVYQEILYEKRPDLVIETGTAHGGSALFMAQLMDTLGNGSVITIDIEKRRVPAHPRITYITSSSTDPATVEDVRKSAAGKKVMVILDSDHSKKHVLAELTAYADMVSPGQYLVVEDSNVNGHPVYRRFGPGPWEAISDFMRGDDRFVVDRKREKFLFTFNPGGFLLRR